MTALAPFDAGLNATVERARAARRRRRNRRAADRGRGLESQGGGQLCRTVRRGGTAGFQGAAAAGRRAADRGARKSTTGRPRRCRAGGRRSGQGAAENSSRWEYFRYARRTRPIRQGCTRRAQAARCRAARAGHRRARHRGPVAGRAGAQPREPACGDRHRQCDQGRARRQSLRDATGGDARLAGAGELRDRHLGTGLRARRDQPHAGGRRQGGVPVGPRRLRHGRQARRGPARRQLPGHFRRLLAAGRAA